MDQRLPLPQSALRASAHATPGLDDDNEGKASTDNGQVNGRHLPLTSPQTIARLQRTIGNQATIRLLRRDSAAPPLRQTITPARASRPRIQRWALRSNNPIDWTQTQQIKTITSGQPVFFFEDTGGDTIVVKAERATFGIADLAAFLHWSISGTRTVFTRDVTPDKPTIVNLINDPNKTSHQSWTDLGNTAHVQKFNWPGTTPAAQARHHHAQQLAGLPKMQAMSVAPGKTIRKLATAGALSPGDKSARWLFDNADYLYKLGIISATDLFLENGDRVISGNFGNWFTDPNGAITLIDNIDQEVLGMFRANAPLDSDRQLRMLAKGALQNTARLLVNGIEDGLTQEGDQTATEWLNQPKKGGTRRAWMQAELLKGLKEGKARIIRRLATRKMSRKGRMVKQWATQSHAYDTARGDNPKTAYWETLKARARWLSKN